MSLPSRTGQAELAARLGLSQSTVSRALANSPLVSAATRRRVQALARKLGYAPDPVLASLNAYLHSKRPMSRGTVLAWLGHGGLAPAHRRPADWEATVFFAAQHRAEELGYVLEYFSLRDPQRSLPSLDRMLWSRGVAGLMIGPQPRPHSRLPLDMGRWCAVTVSKTLYAPKIDQISVDHGQELSRCYRRLRGLGYRRIGLVMSHTFDEKTYGLWRGGYLAEQSRRRERRPVPVLICPEADGDSLVRWVNRYRPDCLMTAFEGNRRHIEALGRAGYRVPRDMGVAFLNLGVSPLCNTLSGVEEPNAEIGECAVDVLVGRIRNNQRGVPARRIVHLLEGVWREGATLRRQNRPARRGGHCG